MNIDGFDHYISIFENDYSKKLIIRAERTHMWADKPQLVWAMPLGEALQDAIDMGETGKRELRELINSLNDPDDAGELVHQGSVTVSIAPLNKLA